MYVPDVELHQAATLDEAASLMARHGPDARLLAGGTDLLVDLKTGRVSARHLVSLNRLDALRGIAEAETGLRIGALTTITELGSSMRVRESYAAILDAALQMAAQQIRNMATVGGNIACAVPCADLPPILTAMRATVTLWSERGERELPLEAFFKGPRETAMRDDEVLTAVHVPKPPPGFGAAYARFAQRDGNAIAVAAVAASLLLDGNGIVREGRVVLNAVAPTPKLVPEAGDALIGRPPDERAFRAAAAAARAAAEPITDVRGSADLRRGLVEVLARRALRSAFERAGAAGA
ncbi:MAG: FAD binding domain-containing protein [Planctomycetota bacterium]